MNRKKDRDLAKIYKDLMITKRDLIDLRESINNTINSIRESDEQMRRIDAQRKLRQNSQEYQIVFNSAAPPPLQTRCQLCSALFANIQALRLHKNEKHQKCKDCHKEINQSFEEHFLFTCGETKLLCQVCSSLVKRQQYDKHVKVCCFRECYKCKQSVSTRAFSYHLQECKRSKNTNLITPCKRMIQQARPLVLPCCLLLENGSANPQ